MINITRKRAVVPVFSATVLCFFLLNFLSSHSQQETKANEKESRLRIEESQCPKLSIGECSRWTSNGQEKIVNSWLFNSTDCGQSHNDEIILQAGQFMGPRKTKFLLYPTIVNFIPVRACTPYTL